MTDQETEREDLFRKVLFRRIQMLGKIESVKPPRFLLCQQVMLVFTAAFAWRPELMGKTFAEWVSSVSAAEFGICSKCFGSMPREERSCEACDNGERAAAASADERDRFMEDQRIKRLTHQETKENLLREAVSSRIKVLGELDSMESGRDRRHAGEEALSTAWDGTVCTEVMLLFKATFGWDKLIGTTFAEWVWAVAGAERGVCEGCFGPMPHKTHACDACVERLADPQAEHGR